MSEKTVFKNVVTYGPVLGHILNWGKKAGGRRAAGRAELGRQTRHEGRHLSTLFLDYIE